MGTASSTGLATDVRERTAAFAIAGLLHDVGKILEPTSIQLDSTALALESRICPVNRRTGRPSHRHVLYTAHALATSKLRLGGLDAEFVQRIANAHHRPGDTDEHILQAADHFASGHDRRSAPAEEEAVVTGLISVVSRLRRGGQEREHIRTASLAFSPEHIVPRASQSIGDYRDACTRLSHELIRGLGVPFASPSDAVDRVDALLQRVATSVPSSRSRTETPDVSLYDHSRIVAAFAACLSAQVESSDPTSAIDQATFRLVSVSLGGIQDFIFRRLALADSPASPDKGMAKQLRGRSFLVTLVTSLVARRILDTLMLPSVCKLLDAGGRTVLLVPGGETYSKALEEAERLIRREFSKKLGGPLRLDLAISDALASEDFKADRFALTYRRLLDRVDQRRRSGAAAILRNDGRWADDGWIFDAPGMPIDRARFAEQIRSIGQSLPRAQYLGCNEESREASGHFSLFGLSATLHEDSDRLSGHLALELDDDLTRPVFLTGNYVPRLQSIDASDDDELRAGDPIPFDLLAARSTDGEGTPIGMHMLGAIKADVDRLGWLFGYGLKERLSFGRLSTLSRAIDGFFKNFVRYRLRTQFANLYTVFAGGDDLFLIGPWYDVVRFSQSLRTDFSAFTAENPNLTFSAGIVFAKPGASVRALADAADEAIDAAKDAGRDRLSIAGSVLRWSEMERAFRLHTKLQEAFADGNQRRGSLLYRLLEYSNMARRAQTNPTLADLKWRAQMSYDLRRNVSSNDSSPIVSAALTELSKIAPGDADVLRIAAMLTLYATRGGDE